MPNVYPMSLRDLKEEHGFKKGGFHVYAEWNGLRYFLASKDNVYEAQSFAIDRQHEHKDACIFIRDRADSTVINGIWGDLTRDKNLKKGVKGKIVKNTVEYVTAKGRGRLVNAWSIVDDCGKSLVLPWSKNKKEAKELAEKLGIKL